MLFGNPEIFAIESEISKPLPSLSERGIGFFVVHVAGTPFGIRDPQATLLACSYDEVGERIERRGRHSAPFLSDISAEIIAARFLEAVYEDSDSDFFGMSSEEFSGQIYNSFVPWAPDGDEAFDDGSHILQFDIDEMVRLVAFKRGDDSRGLATCIKNLWLEADVFYGLLTEWHSQFGREWTRLLSN